MSRRSGYDEPRKPKVNECRFCYKEDHYVADCPLFKRVHIEAAERKDGKHSANKALEVTETSNVALVEESDSDIYYSYPIIANALLATPLTVWALDSGASKHFTGVLSDLTNLKRWNSERSVRIANGTIVPAVGYGCVQLGGLLLKEVWYVPQFKTTRLISVRTLMKSGYQVIFDDEDRAVLSSHSKLIEAEIWA